jgi:transcriptional regulator GlxA family with amidase domain
VSRESPGASERGDWATERQVAIVAYQGVLADESHAFRAVLGRAPGVHLVTVGERVGPVAGPGGVQVVDATFDDVRSAAIVAVPGGLGSHRHPEIAAWTLAARPDWVLASSTGSALLAAAGVLRGRAATTHWLAGPLLERHGVTLSHERVVVDEPFVTCRGSTCTYDAVYHVVQRVWGPGAVARIRAEIAAAPAEEPPAPCEVRSRYRPRPLRPARPPRNPVVEVELEDGPPRWR